MFSRREEIDAKIDILDGSVRRLDTALRWPMMATEEGYPHLQELARREADYRRGCSCEDGLQLLLEYLGLEIEEGKRIVKKGRRK